ncbi:unnamed protein product, partial [Allacma fusca]
NSDVFKLIALVVRWTQLQGA